MSRIFFFMALREREEEEEISNEWKRRNETKQELLKPQSINVCCEHSKWKVLIFIDRVGKVAGL